jgi:hypothetical protein
MDEQSIVNTAALNAWWAQNFIHVSIWTLITAMIIAVVLVQRNRTPIATKAEEEEPKKKDPLYSRIWQAFKYRLWYKPRGFVMKTRKQRERATATDDIIAIRCLMVIEMAWLAGELTHEDYKRNVNRMAERFSKPAMYEASKLKLLKQELKRRRKEGKLPLTLKEAGIKVPPTGTEKGEGENKTSLLNFKAA